MSIGYNPADFVWSIDRTTGRAAPLRRDLIALNPSNYQLDEKHDVVDARGVLLPGKPRAEKGDKPDAEPTQTNSGAAGKKE